MNRNFLYKRSLNGNSFLNKGLRYFAELRSVKSVNAQSISAAFRSRSLETTADNIAEETANGEKEEDKREEEVELLIGTREEAGVEDGSEREGEGTGVTAVEERGRKGTQVEGVEEATGEEVLSEEEEEEDEEEPTTLGIEDEEGNVEDDVGEEDETYGTKALLL